MRQTFIQLACFIIYLLAHPVSAANYYVSGSGSDSNSGTATNAAWLTITKVNAQTLSAGDRVFFQGGTTFSGSIQVTSPDTSSIANPIIFSSYGVGRATITNAGDTFYALNVGGLVVSNLNFVGSGRTVSTGNGIQFYNNTANTSLNFIRVDNVEVSGFTNGIYIRGISSNAPINDVRITHAFVHDIKTIGIEVITDNRLHYNVHSNYYIGSCTISNVTGYSGAANTGNGIRLGMCNNALIENCLAVSNCYLGSAAVAIWCWNSKNVTIQFCEAHHNGTAGTQDGGAFDIDGGSTGCVVQYCYSHDNDGAGYGIYQFDYAPPFSNNIVRYNISQNDGRKNSYAGIFLYNGQVNYPYGMSDIHIYNNTIYNTKAASGTSRALYMYNTATNVYIRNNIFVTTNSAPLMSVPSSGVNVVCQGNDWWPSGGTFAITWAGTTYSSLSAWRTATSQEKIGTTNVGFNLNPQLISAGGGGTLATDASQLPAVLATLTNYQTQITSSMRGAGLNLYTLFGINMGSQDYYGNPVTANGTLDIGAYNAVTTVTPLIATVPMASAITYGQTLGSSGLSGGVTTNAAGEVVAGTFSFTTPATMPNAGSTNVSVTFAPTDTATYNNATANVTVTVNKATPVIKTLPSATAITYGQILTNSALSGGSATNATGGTVVGTFTFTAAATAPNAGIASQGVTFTPTDTVNYSNAATSVNVTVNKATPVITVAPTPSVIVYGQTLADSSLSGGTATNVAGGTVSGIFVFDLPDTAPGAGVSSQLVDFIPTDTANYNLYDSTINVNVTVNKATPVIVVAPTASAITYGQTLASSSLSGGAASTAGSFAFTTPTMAPNVGTASQGVTFTPTDVVNYSNATTSVSVTVNPQTPAVATAPTASTITYGQTLADSTLSGGLATNAAGSAVAGSFTFTTPATVPNVGTASQEVTFTPTDAANYNPASTSASVTVDKATLIVEVAPTASAITYGQTLADSTLSGGSATNAAGGTVAGTFTFTTPGIAPNAGSTNVSVTFVPTDTATYNDAITSVSVTVNSLISPTLTVGLVASNLQIGWSDSATNGFTLQTATNLDQTSVWSNVLTITNVGGVTLPASNPASFFRLYKP